MTNTYDKGDMIRLSSQFTISSVLTDPTAITLLIIDPDRSTGTYTYVAGQVQKSATGSYYMDISLDLVGRWDYRFIGTGTVQATADSLFLVRRTDF
jgi:hypothetical protein